MTVSQGKKTTKEHSGQTLEREFVNNTLNEKKICEAHKVQARKSARRMPWHRKPKKDVTSCEKLRGGANIQRSADIRMRELSTSNIVLSYTE